MKTETWAILTVLASGFIGSWAVLLLKIGVDSVSLQVRAVLSSPYVLGGIALSLVYSFLYIIALRGGQLSVLYPLVSLNYVWVALLSARFLQERFNLLKVVGLVMVVVGVVCIGIGNQ
jgi:drug/metabolite transporter (DMT)-like permease